MYTQLLSYVGEGVVGGSVTRFDDEGSNTGRLIVRVLRRPRGERMPPVQFILNSYVADWRQLRRWGLSDERLPSGTEVLFRQPSPWERYRRAILVTLGVLSAQLLLIGLLLIERARRKQAQMVIEEQQRRVEEARRQIVHMGRVALVGELAATIGHEIRQPLAAIRANAEAGARFVSGKSKEFAADDRQISADIFADIVADTDRVSATITRVRALLRNEELPAAPVDLNDVCRTAARLLQHDALTRNAEIALLLDPDLPAIAADSVQFLQVVLNLVLNALDASSSSIHPEVLITTSARDEGVEVAVSDNGPGLAADVQQHLFESFFTTKTQGLGLGLVIVQSIVERHGGRVRPENRVQGGATFRITIPRARSGQFASSATSQNRLESEKAPVQA
jgi:signal transduction histidine kinase